jgi:riboflavin kinase / FMN adenylyltransferase
MRILDCSAAGNRYLGASVATVGNFDGIHRGHAELFRQLKDRGDRLCVPTVVVTFDPHPLAVLAPLLKPALITSFSQKAKLIEQSGIDCLAVIRFTREFSRLPAQSFVRSYLSQMLGMRHIVIGHDYAFGRDRSGNYDTLSEMGRECDFSVESLRAVGEGSGRVYSSTLVRRLVAGGDMRGAAAVLGRDFAIPGRLAQGSAGGSRGGSAALRLVPENDLVPLEGAYSVRVSLGDRIAQGICRVDRKRSLELVLQDPAAQLYRGSVSVRFCRRLGALREHRNPEPPADRCRDLFSLEREARFGYAG